MECYDSSVLSEHLPANSSNTEFTLYVNNLPEELDKHGFLQIFNHYGNVIGHFYRSNLPWGYITYGASHEAQNAIKDLDNVPPLRLKVAFSRRRAAKEMESTKAPVDEGDTNIGKQEDKCMAAPLSSMETTRRGNPMDVFKTVKPTLVLPSYTGDNDLLYNYPTDPSTYNPYENPGPYPHTNSLWTREKVMTSQDGKRHIVGGRGYTMYEIPIRHSQISNYINLLSEKRSSSSYEQGHDIMRSVGKCKKCDKLTKFNCERCQIFYCNKSCQIADWPQHKLECQSIPALEEAVTSVSISQNHNEEQTHNRSIPSVQIPLRRPKKSQSTTASQNKDESSCDTNNQDIIVTTAKPDMNDIKHSNQADKFASIPTQSKNALPSSDNSKDHKKSDSFKAKKRQNKIFLSKSKFTDVKIMINDGREYWVQKLEDNDGIVELMTNLQQLVEDTKKIKPVVGEIYAVKYENLWHRVLVKSLNPLTVHYIDFGNEEVVEEPDFRKISQLTNIPNYAFKIRLSEKALVNHRNLNYEDIISVKMISIDENEVINVKVQGENDAPTVQSERNVIEMPNVQNLSPEGIPTAVLKALLSNRKAGSAANDSKKTANTQKPESVVKTLSVGDAGVLEIHAELSSHVYSVTLLPHKAVSNFEKLFQELADLCDQAGKNSNHRPQIGDLVCGKTVNHAEWVRGYVLSLKAPLKIAVIDEANITEVVEIVPCPDNFFNICAFGAKCKIINTNKKFTEKMHPEFKVLACKNQNEIEIKIIDEEAGEVMAVVKPWTPAPEQIGLQCMTLKNNSEVYLTAYRSHVIMFVRPAEDAEHYQHVMQNVAKYAQSASPLSEPPVVGQMVLAHYVDDNYYRAIVTKVEGNKIWISYVDFGNTEILNLTKLKILSDELKQQRPCASKIILKDVPQNVPMTKEINDYLSYIASTQIVLTCVFEGIPSKDGVYLKTFEGKCINKIISEMLVPTWNKAEKEDTTCYMRTDLNIATIGKVGDVVDAIILYAIEDGYTYSVCHMDYELMSQVFDVMPKMMAEYCEKSEYYIPRDNELCLAQFDNAWSRAICYRRAETAESASVFFVDFGNLEVVPHKEIRRMPKDFMSPNAIANICNVVNLAPTNDKKKYSPEIEKRLSELIQLNTCVKLKIVECIEDDGYYTVEIPSVRDQLIQEGLVSL